MKKLLIYSNESCSVNANNSVSSSLPYSIDNFLQDFAQMYGGIDYTDIMNCADSKELRVCVSKIKRELKGYAGDIYELSEEDTDFKNLCDDLVRIVKSSAE